MLLKKLRALRLELFGLKHDYEVTMVVVSPKEANFAELKLIENWWEAYAL